jgi:hypothetical protein
MVEQAAEAFLKEEGIATVTGNPSAPCFKMNASARPKISVPSSSSAPPSQGTYCGNSNIERSSFLGSEQ